MPQETINPLQTEPDSISTLFSRKYTTWTDSDLDRICDHYRSVRGNFSEVPVKRVAKEKVSSVAQEAAASLDLGAMLDGLL